MSDDFAASRTVDSQPKMAPRLEPIQFARSMRRVVVCRQQILAEVVGVVAENGVDVVGSVLRVVILDDKPVVTDVVVVALEALQRACPCEVDAVPTLAVQADSSSSSPSRPPHGTRSDESV